MTLFQQMVLWGFLFYSSIGLGAGLYEARIVLPIWFINIDGKVRVDAQAMNDLDVGRRFWGVFATVPLTLLVFASIYLAWSLPNRPNWWLMAASTTLVERCTTFGYFIPTAIKLGKSDGWDAARASATARLWIRLNGVRLLLTGLSWVAAVKAVAELL